VTTEEIETMLKDMAQLLEFKPTLKRLGLDEITLKAKVITAVLIDLDKSKLVAILAERTQKKITETGGLSIRANRRSEH